MAIKENMVTFISQELKAILFDFGGTLDLNGVHWLNCFYRLYREFNLGVAEPDIKQAFYSADAFLEKLPGKEGLTFEPMIKEHVHFQFEFLSLNNAELEKQMVHRFCTEVKRNRQRNQALLRKLSRKYKLGVISNFYGNVCVLCKEAGFSPYLEVIIDSQEVGIKKPDPGIFLMAIDKMGLSPNLAAFVGDSFSQDMKPAKKVGMKTVWLKTGETAPFPGDWQKYVDLEIGSLHLLEEIFL